MRREAFLNLRAVTLFTGSGDIIHAMGEIGFFNGALARKGSALLRVGSGPLRSLCAIAFPARETSRGGSHFSTRLSAEFEIRPTPLSSFSNRTSPSFLGSTCATRLRIHSPTGGP
jgi:hypothetical protein